MEVVIETVEGDTRDKKKVKGDDKRDFVVSSSLSKCLPSLIELSYDTNHYYQMIGCVISRTICYLFFPVHMI